MDEYIAEKPEEDLRTPREIEIAAKISATGAPLHRRCDNTECTRVDGDGRGSSLMNFCGGCRILSYCSRDCQKEHWKLHRPDCSSGNTNAIRPKYLPSQIALRNRLREDRDGLSPEVQARFFSELSGGTIDGRE